MELLTENPWPLQIFLSVASIVLLGLWYQHHRLGLLLGGLTALLLMPACWCYEQSVITPGEKVEMTLREMVSAFQRGDVMGTTAHISPSTPELAALATAAAGLVKLDDDLRVSDLHIDLKNGQSRAVAKFRANGTIISGQNRQFQPSRWLATWQLENGEWKLVKLAQLNVMTGEVLNDYGSVVDFQRMFRLQR